MGLSVLRLAGGAVHGSESHAGAAVARRSSANPRAACARLLHSIRERERDWHQSERCGYPFGAADPASLPSPRRCGVIIYRQWAINKKSARLGETAGSFTSQFFPAFYSNPYRSPTTSTQIAFSTRTDRMAQQISLSHEFVEFIPDDLRQGTIYVSIRFATATHLCCCGCGEKVVTPLRPTD